MSLEPQQSLQTWPDGGYGGTGHNVSWELDTRFGNVLSCNAVSGPDFEPKPFGPYE